MHGLLELEVKLLDVELLVEHIQGHVDHLDELEAFRWLHSGEVHLSLLVPDEGHHLLAVVLNHLAPIGLVVRKHLLHTVVEVSMVTENELVEQGSAIDHFNMVPDIHVVVENEFTIESVLFVFTLDGKLRDLTLSRCLIRPHIFIRNEGS